MHMPRILISILNWNKAVDTLECLASLRHQHQEGMQVDIMVIDNGSRPEDYQILQAALTDENVNLLRLETNLGFTGGHNVSLRIALDKAYDFAWLLNNDATVEPGTLVKLVREMVADERCGAASPVLYPMAGVEQEHGWGFRHDWRSRSHPWIPSAAHSIELHREHPDEICLAGTAILLRVDALRETGLLDERLFAYYDDNDICVRMSRKGWNNKVVFDASATHETRELGKQPPYFFYLMFRNELIFWHTHMPEQHRKLIWLKLLNQSLYHVNRLRLRGYPQQAESALLGVWDFIRGRHGAPAIRKPSQIVRLGSRLHSLLHRKQLQMSVTGQKR